MISSVVIAILSPVETENNPLDEVEKHVYRVRTYIVLGIEIAVTIVTLCLHIRSSNVDSWKNRVLAEKKVTNKIRGGK